MELRPDTILQGKYSVIEKIGEGCFGRVYKGINLQQKDYVAIKQIPNQKFRETPKLKELFNSEVKILKAVKNENVVSYVDYFEQNDACFLVQEFCDCGDLEQYLKKRRTIPETEAVEFFKQILNGFKGLHEIPAIHRDLKAANILIHNKNTLKIADLGFGKIIKDNNLGVTVLGTSLTMAPEVLENKKYGLEVDVYSLGVIFYQMLFGCFPYTGKSDPDLLNNIKKYPLNLQPNQIKISDNMKDLLKRMICYQREKRIRWFEVYKHPIFSEERRANSNNISLAHLQSSRIQINQNRDFYEKGNNKLEQNFNFPEPQMNPYQQQQQQQYQQQYQQQQQQQQYQQQQQQQQFNQYGQQQYNNGYNNQNNQQQIQNDFNSPANRQNQYPNLNQNDNGNIDKEKLQRIKDEAKQNQVIKEHINKVAERYLHYRNLYGQLIKTVSQAHTLPNTSINTFVPIFLIQKKLFVMNKNLLQSLTEKKNIFNLPFFDKFLTSNIYTSCLKLVSEEQLIISLYFQQLKNEVSQILSRMQNANLQLKEEVENENLTDNYNQILRQTIINYQMNLAQERHRFPPAEQQIIFIHEVQVLDIIVIDRYLEKVDYDFEQHNNDIQNIQPNKYDEILDQKLNELFDF